MFFVTRDLGYVNKLFRGLSADEHRPDEPEQTTEKLWVAAVETFAIGGACQILHTVDHVIATTRHAALSAGSQGGDPPRRVQPAARALRRRSSRAPGDPLGPRVRGGHAAGDLLCDEVVESSEEMDVAIARRVEELTSSGLVNAAGNRRALRVGSEPLDVFRQYMATFCREQAYCHFSPALVRNLEQHWNAHERRL